MGFFGVGVGVDFFGVGVGVDFLVVAASALSLTTPVISAPRSVNNTLRENSITSAIIRHGIVAP